MITIGVTKHILDNGLTVLIRENHSAPTVAIVTYVKAGYFNESDRLVGISHLIEHMFFKGTSRRGVGQIANETKSLGGYLNASTIYDYTLYYTVLPSRNFSRGLDIQSDALIHSIFDPEELRKETEVIIEEAKRKQDIPMALAAEKLFELAFDKHRMRRWRIGTEAGLRSLTREDFLAFHQNLYRPENIILVVAGDVDKRVALNEIEKYYKDFERGILKKVTSPPEPRQTRFKYRQLRGDIQQSYLELAFHAPPLLHPDSYALEILAVILGYGRSSRLFQQVKENKHLVNTIAASDYLLPDLGIFLIEANAQPPKLRDAEAAVMEEIEQVRKTWVAPEELTRARNLVESIYVFSMESAAGQANLLAAYEALGDYRLAEEHVNKLNAVTAEDIHRVANDYLTLTNCSLLEYVPKDAALDFVETEELTRRFARHLAPAKPPDILSQPAFAERVASYMPRNGRDTEIAKHVLSNGMTILIKESHQIPLAAVGIFARGGRGNETLAEAGLTGLMLRTSLKGTQNRSAAQIASEIENLGSAIHFTNAADYFYYSMGLLSKNFAAGFDILADIITEPAFPEVEIAKEKKNVLAQILREQDDMSQHPFNLFYALLFKGHAYAVPPNGKPEAVQSFQREQLQVWHHRYGHPKNLLAVVVGDVETDKTIELMKKRFGNWPFDGSQNENKSMIADPNKIEELIETREREQTALVLGFPGPRYNDDDYYALLVLQNAIAGLGGRFFEELRSRQGLAYTVSVSAVSRLHGGAFVSYIAMSPEKEAAAKSGLLAEFAKLTREPLTEEELRRSIQFTVGTHQIGLETYRAQMLEYAHNELLGKGVDEVHLFPQKIERVTAEDILRAAQKYFDLNRYALAMVRGINHKN